MIKRRQGQALTVRRYQAQNRPDAAGLCRS